MNLAIPVIELLIEVGKFVNAKNATALHDRVLDLKRRYNEELSKGDMVDDALLYSLNVELQYIIGVYSSTLKGQGTSD